MKKLLALLLSFVLLLTLSACGTDVGEDDGALPDTEASAYRVAMIADCRDITDRSFNQTIYEACKTFCVQEELPFVYHKPAENNVADQIAVVEQAISEGYNVLVLSGYTFAGMISAVQDRYPQVMFLALDVSEFDIEESFYQHDETGARTMLIDPENEPHIGENVYCAVYQEELCGYMAGYAAVKLGYEHLGFLGGKAYPAVQRFGYGYVQGADAAAAESGTEVTVEYLYGNQFEGTPAITDRMDTWYQELGVEVVFACGGGIYTSAAEAASRVRGAKVIGVDVDQSKIIDSAYGEGLTVTSAMKGLAATVNHILAEIVAGNFDAYGGRVETLGLVSGEDPTLNYAQLPLETTQWDKGFTEADYRALVKALFEGEIQVSADVSMMPAHEITVNVQEDIA